MWMERERMEREPESEIESVERHSYTLSWVLQRHSELVCSVLQCAAVCCSVLQCVCVCVCKTMHVVTAMLGLIPEAHHQTCTNWCSVDATVM